MKTGTTRTFIFLILTMVAATAAAAGTPIKESKAAPADAIVSIENLNGPVTVTGWSKKEVEVTGTLGDGPERLDFEVRGDEVIIEVIWPDHDDNNFNWGRHNPEETVLNIKVPQGNSLEVEGVNSTLDVSGVDGELELSSVNGNITVSGDPEEIDAGTVNGDVEIDSSSKEITAETVNGEIRINGSQGEISASTVNGSILITGDLKGRSEFGSVSGDIEFTGDLLSRGPYEFESHSGSIVLTVPEDLSAEFEIETFSGKISNDFGSRARKTSEYGPGYELNFETGDGRAQVEISSFSGRVAIKTQ